MAIKQLAGPKKRFNLWHYLDKHRHQDSVFASLQWWQKKKNTIQKHNLFMPQCMLGLIGEFWLVVPSMHCSIKLFIDCHHCWDSYTDSWYLFVSNNCHRLKPFVHYFFLKFCILQCHDSAHAIESTGHYYDKTKLITHKQSLRLWTRPVITRWWLYNHEQRDKSSDHVFSWLSML